MPAKYTGLEFSTVSSDSVHECEIDVRDDVTRSSKLFRHWNLPTHVICNLFFTILAWLVWKYILSFSPKRWGKMNCQVTLFRFMHQFKFLYIYGNHIKCTWYVNKKCGTHNIWAVWDAVTKKKDAGVRRKALDATEIPPTFLLTLIFLLYSSL